MNLFNKQICRTCMSEVKTVQTLHYIYDSPIEGSTQSIADLLLATTPQLHIEIKDNLPKNICMECLNSLLKMADFQKMCLQSECKLLEMFTIRAATHSSTDATVSEVMILPNSSTSNSSTLMVADEDPLQNRTWSVKKEVDELSIDSWEDIIEDAKEETIEDTIEKKKRKTNSAAMKKSKRLKSRRGKKECTAVKSEDHKDIDVPSETIPLISIQKMSTPELVDNTEELEPLNTDVGKSKKTRKKSTKKPPTDKETNSSDKNSTDKNSTDKKPKKRKTSRHACEICDKVFTHSWTLKVHKRVHTGEQPYLCPECGKAFNRQTSLHTHLERHSGEKRYECPDCPKKFLCFSDLYAHKKRHGSIKPYVCDICNYGFLTRNQLTSHKMHHNGEKPYKCEYCDKRFSHTDNVRRHQRTHTGEKPYKCQYCVRAFAQSNDLMKHLRTHLGENVYRCELCPQGFRLASLLREHFPSHKNDDEATRLKNLNALKEEQGKLKAIFTAEKNEEVGQRSSSDMAV